MYETKLHLYNAWCYALNIIDDKLKNQMIICESYITITG